MFCLNNDDYSCTIDSMCEDTQGKYAFKFPSYRIALALLCIIKYNITLYLRLKQDEWINVRKAVLFLDCLVQDPWLCKF